MRFALQITRKNGATVVGRQTLQFLDDHTPEFALFRACTDRYVIRQGRKIDLELFPRLPFARLHAHSKRDPAGNPVDLLGNPIHLAGSVMPEATMPPGLGEQTDRVLSELLGLDASAVAILRERGVV